MSIAEKITRAKTDYDEVYNAGYEKGKSEGGGGIDYDKFWDNFQGGNGRVSYAYAFAYDRFDDETYNPKYPIVCSSGSTTAQNIFYNNTRITSTKVPVDVTNVTGSASLRQTFMVYQSSAPSILETIVELKVKSANTYDNTFGSCVALKNITITGTIGNNISFEWSPLTKESILSVFNALSTDVTGKTVTFKKTAVNAAFTTDEWNALIAPKKPYWTFTLS